jgi:hypothetical protein
MALVERQLGYIAAIEPQQVENVIGSAILAPGNFAVEDDFSHGQTLQRLRNRGAILRETIADNSRTSFAWRKATSRIPSNLRSKTHFGPVKRSWVRLAAIGSIHSGMGTKAIMTDSKPCAIYIWAIRTASTRCTGQTRLEMRYVQLACTLLPLRLSHRIQRVLHRHLRATIQVRR